MEASLARLAVLIDGDNVGPNLIAGLCKQTLLLGHNKTRRVYKDWSQGPDWKPVLLKYALDPIQQFAYAKGKNAIDIAMVIDAIDLAQTGQYDAFCLVSSDSDFTPLAVRLRQKGLTVYGFGETKSPSSFQQSCDRFFFLNTSPKSKTNAA